MTTPSDHDDESGRSASAAGDDSGNHDNGGREPKVDLGKPSDEPFDPYRFGKPDHPVPPEYAPPGYVPEPTPPTNEAPGGPYPYGAPPYNQYPPSQYPPGPYPPSPYPPSPYPPNQNPYGQTPSYGQAPYPVPPHGPAYHQRSNGKATTSMVLGIVAIVLCFTSFLDVVLIIPAIVLGFMGLNEAKARNGVGRGQAITGLVCAGVAAVLAITLTVLVVRATDRCGGTSQSGEPGFNQCLQDNIFSQRDLGQGRTVRSTTG